MSPYRLELCGITKRYPSVLANDGVDLAVAPGQIHAVLGENGAGKSTLMKIIFGAVKPDAGEMFWNGQPLTVRSPADARRQGIAMVFQHFSLFGTLTVAENVWLGLSGQGSLDAVRVRIRELCHRYGLPLDTEATVHSLSVGEQQRVEIIRALMADPQLLILDEPTSVLTPQAVQALFGTLRQLAAEGRSILYISHKLDEIRDLCHHCTVLRGGRKVAEVDPTQLTAADLAQLMIGDAPPQVLHELREPGAVMLQVRDLSLPAIDPRNQGLHKVSLEVRAGEVVGIAGVSGNGQQLLLSVLSGEDTRAPADRVLLAGEPVGKLGVRHRRRRGLRLVPEERLGRGAVPPLSLADNMLLSHAANEGLVGRGGWLRRSRMTMAASKIIERFRIKAGGGARAAARSLSGGNLQKYIVGREVMASPRVLIVAQPTWGVDVGASAQIRNALLALRDEGCAVLVVSEELDELFEIADRLAVISAGRLSPQVPAASLSREKVGLWMSGLWEAEHAAA